MSQVFIAGGTGYIGRRLVVALIARGHQVRVLVLRGSERATFTTLIPAGGLPRTVVRPWYVPGPGHRWPYVLIPIYLLLEQLPQTRESARRLGLVTIAQMVAALVDAVEHPATSYRLMEVPEIRSTGSG